MPVSDYDAIFEAAGKEWNVDPHLLRAIATQESGGRPDLVNPKSGAQGIMQVMPATGKEIGLAKPFDPTENIFAGAKYYSQMLDKYGRPDHALVAYNAGPGRADDFFKRGGTLPAEALAYVPAVTGHYQRLKGATVAGNVPQGNAKSEIDAFLNETAPTTTKAASDPQSEIDAFLKETGATDAPTAPAQAPIVAPDPDSRRGSLVAPVEGSGQPIPMQSDEPAPAQTPASPFPIAAPAAHIGRAIASPWQEPSAVSQKVAEIEAAYPNVFGSNMMGPANRLIMGGAALIPQALEFGGRAIQSVARGAGALVGEGAAALGVDPAIANRAERDFAQAPDALLPMFMGGAPKTPGAAIAENRLVSTSRAPETVAIDNALAPAPGSPAYARDPIRPTAPTAEPPAPSSPISGPRPVAPESVGAAATPFDLTGVSPKEAKAYLATAEGSRFMEPQAYGQVDATQYVPGSRPTAAQIAQTADMARTEKQLAMKNPDPFKGLEASNNDARVSFMDQTAGNPTTSARMREDLDAQFTPRREAVFKNKTEVDASPVLDDAREILSGPTALRAPVKAAVQDVVDALRNGNKLHDDPEMLYGLRQRINDSIAGKGTNDAAQYKLAQKELIRLRDTLDGVIEQGAPGFKAYIKDYSEAIKPIEASEYLQSKQRGLLDSQGTMTPAKVNALLREIVDARQMRTPHPAQSLTEDQMNNLWALRNDLRRQEAASRLAGTRGSDTAQNLWDMTKGIAGAAGNIGAHAAANTIMPVGGSFVYNAAKDIIGGKMSANKLLKATEAHINPSIPLKPLRPD